MMKSILLISIALLFVISFNGKLNLMNFLYEYFELFYQFICYIEENNFLKAKTTTSPKSTLKTTTTTPKSTLKTTTTSPKYKFLLTI